MINQSGILLYTEPPRSIVPRDTTVNSTYLQATVVLIFLAKVSLASGLHP